MKVYQKHIVAIVDFLGFKEALLSEEKAIKILSLLKQLKAGESSKSSAILNKVNSGQKEIRVKCKEIRVKCSISAFSDHVAISVSEEIFNETISLRHAVTEILNIIQQLARVALHAGFLLRGGITVGKLYHESGVIFGEALVDAHELESKIAIYPRIVASQTLVSRFRQDSNGGPYKCFIIQDIDGMHHLDYLSAMFQDLDLAAREKLNNIIKENLDRLQGNDRKLKEFAKWKWFEQYYTNSTKSAY